MVSLWVQCRVITDALAVYSVCLVVDVGFEKPKTVVFAGMVTVKLPSTVSRTVTAGCDGVVVEPELPELPELACLNRA